MTVSLRWWDHWREPMTKLNEERARGGVRLQKALADAGVASRRHAEDLIRAGRVFVNGQAVQAMGVTVHPLHDQIVVDGRPIIQREGHTYLILHKPRRVLTTASDPHGRPTVMHYVTGFGRVFPVGRLDYESEGLVFMTDDGDLANRLIHPRYEHEKEYRVLLAGRLSDATMKRLRRGAELDDGRAAPTRVSIEKVEGTDTWVRIILKEGRNREIRRIMEALGLQVKRLVRVRLGPLHLDDLPPGEVRRATRAELAGLETIRKA